MLKRRKYNNINRIKNENVQQINFLKNKKNNHLLHFTLKEYSLLINV